MKKLPLVFVGMLCMLTGLSFGQQVQGQSNQDRPQQKGGQQGNGQHREGREKMQGYSERRQELRREMREDMRQMRHLREKMRKLREEREKLGQGRGGEERMGREEGRMRGDNRMGDRSMQGDRDNRVEGQRSQEVWQGNNREGMEGDHDRMPPDGGPEGRGPDREMRGANPGASSNMGASSGHMDLDGRPMGLGN